MTSADAIELIDDIEQFETQLELDTMLADIDIPSEPKEWVDVVSFGPRGHAVLGFRYKPSGVGVVYS